MRQVDGERNRRARRRTRQRRPEPGRRRPETAHLRSNRRGDPGRSAAMSRPTVVVLVAVVAMTVLRVLHLLELQAHSVFFENPMVDALEYLTEARARATGNPEYTVPRHGPLYPLLLGWAYALSAGSAFVLHLCTSLVGQATALLLYFGGRRVCGAWPAAAAAVLFAFYRPGLLYECEYYAAGLANLAVVAVALRLAALPATEPGWRRPVALGDQPGIGSDRPHQPADPDTGGAGTRAPQGLAARPAGRRPGAHPGDGLHRAQRDRDRRRLHRRAGAWRPEPVDGEPSRVRRHRRRAPGTGVRGGASPPVRRRTGLRPGSPGRVPPGAVHRLRHRPSRRVRRLAAAQGLQQLVAGRSTERLRQRRQRRVLLGVAVATPGLRLAVAAGAARPLAPQGRHRTRAGTATRAPRGLARGVGDDDPGVSDGTLPLPARRSAVPVRRPGPVLVGRVPALGRGSHPQRRRPARRRRHDPVGAALQPRSATRGAPSSTSCAATHTCTAAS